MSRKRMSRIKKKGKGDDYGSEEELAGIMEQEFVYRRPRDLGDWVPPERPPPERPPPERPPPERPPSPPTATPPVLPKIYQTMGNPCKRNQRNCKNIN
jgi:hypothetical protein